MVKGCLIFDVSPEDGSFSGGCITDEYDFVLGLGAEVGLV